MLCASFHSASIQQTQSAKGGGRRPHLWLPIRYRESLPVRMLRRSNGSHSALLNFGALLAARVRCLNVATTVTATTAARRATTPGSRRVGRRAWARAPSRSASASAGSCSPCCGKRAAFASCRSWREAPVDTCAMPEPCCPAIRLGCTPTYPARLRRRVPRPARPREQDPRSSVEPARAQGSCARMFDPWLSNAFGRAPALEGRGSNPGVNACVAAGAAGHARLRAGHAA